MDHIIKFDETGSLPKINRSGEIIIRETVKIDEFGYFNEETAFGLIQLEER